MQDERNATHLTERCWRTAQTATHIWLDTRQLFDVPQTQTQLQAQSQTIWHAIGRLGKTKTQCGPEGRADRTMDAAGSARQSCGTDPVA